MDFDVTFNIAQQSFSAWQLGLYGLVFVAIGIAIIAMGEGCTVKAFGVLFAMGAAALSVLAPLSLWWKYSALRDDFLAGKYVELQGCVSDFRPDDPQGHGPESFTVSGQTFEVWPIRLGGGVGFHSTVGTGGPNLANREVRVGYATYHGLNEIVYLAVSRTECRDEE